MSCRHWRNCGIRNGGCCDLHGAISFGCCLECPDSTEIGWVKSRLRKARVGDKVEAAINRIPGIEKHPCKSQDGSLRKGSPCSRIKAALNGI
jgi:hypothetical protein